MPERLSISTNLLRGALIGVLMGALTWLVVAVLHLANPTDARLRLAFLGLVYVVGGFVSGAIAGLLAAITRWWFGAIIVGFAAAIPVITGVAVLEEGAISRELVPDVLWVSLILGAPSGLSLRYVWRKADPFGPIGSGLAHDSEQEDVTNG